MIRVGRIRYVGGKQVIPSYPDFESCVVMTKSSKYGSLGPYELKTEDGYIMENVWQFSKVYESVPAATEVYTQRYRIVAWDHPAEVHLRDNYFTNEYWAWRDKGFTNPIAVRYPVGRNNMGKCKFAIPCDVPIPEGDIHINDIEQLDYITARKRIYLPLYTQLVRTQAQYSQLLEKLRSGTNLLIIEVDGPHQESLSYYETKYGVDRDFIDDHTMLVTSENINIMLHDSRHPFGHGYCLAWSLYQDK